MRIKPHIPVFRAWSLLKGAIEVGFWAASWQVRLVFLQWMPFEMFIEQSNATCVLRCPTSSL